MNYPVGTLFEVNSTLSYLNGIFNRGKPIGLILEKFTIHSFYQPVYIFNYPEITNLNLDYQDGNGVKYYKILFVSGENI